MFCSYFTFTKLVVKFSWLETKLQFAQQSLQVSRHLFRWTKEIAYADYYERALINGVLSIQRGRDPGVMIYMLPQGPGRSKAKSYHGWGTQYESSGAAMALVS
jgi:hypothetical protein